MVLVRKKIHYTLIQDDDLRDKLGKSKFFSTLDLASGYWQICMHPNSQEKTAFVTHKVLYEFRVRLVIKQLDQAGLNIKPS